MMEQSSIRPFLNWTKQRIDEMDATLASFEDHAAKSEAESRVKSDRLIAELEKRRDEFQAYAAAQAEAGEAALKTGKAQLETQWKAFEAQVETHLETAGKKMEQQKGMFQRAAAAQVKAWHEATEIFQSEAAKIATIRRADIEAAVTQMKADAAEAEVRLQKLKQAGSEAWSALRMALAESRDAFDQSNQKIGKALKRSTKAGPA